MSIYVANSLNHLKIASTHTLDFARHKTTQCGQVTSHGVTSLAEVMACSNMAPNYCLSSSIAITPLLDITKIIYDLCHYGTCDLAKHNVFTN